MHPILARALSAPKPPVAGTQEPISAQDFDLRDVYEASPVGGIIGPLSDLYYSTKGRSTPEEQKEADKAQQPAPPVTKPRTPQQTEELNKLLGRDYKSVGIEDLTYNNEDVSDTMADVLPGVRDLIKSGKSFEDAAGIVSDLISKDLSEGEYWDEIDKAIGNAN